MSHKVHEAVKSLMISVDDTKLQQPRSKTSASGIHVSNPPANRYEVQNKYNPGA